MQAKAESKKQLTASQEAAREPFLPLIRELARAYQAFCSFDEEHIRTLGLTGPQFDVIATLGNTSGMMMGQLAEKTLVTKGTLTGIIDRLEQKGLVRREVPPDNRRCFRIVLTNEGEKVFEEVFPTHINHLKERFSQLSEEEIEQITATLRRVRELF
ncbi:MAG: MarR family transcriptional regulator [Leptolyngbyaceae cyanobacterium HOT.MB2.61]|jgi:MarR family 2-MHQ and catechol resistance regulon transcriptional repressor|nr:MarR family transcriptional regulator [Leptolyngbyaceae cyanobacterium HOT.MB2.61]